MDGHRTVVMLGAGASFGSAHSLPTMANFWNASIENLPSELQTFLNWFNSSNHTASHNLEDVLGYLDLARHRSAAWGTAVLPEGLDPQRLYAAVLDDVRHRLTVPLDHPCGSHEKLFRALEPSDTVLTLNYDLIADVALRAVEQVNGQLPQDSRLEKMGSIIGTPDFVGGVPPSLLPREETSGFYLKLHGSLDWLRCTTPGCPNSERLFAINVENLGEGQEAGRPCRLCGTPVAIFLVPPVASKRIEDRGRLAFVWSLALRELQAADQIVIAGLSIAPSDFELRWLLRAARASRPLDNLSIANPDLAARASTIALLGSPSTSIKEYDYLAQLAGAVAAEPETSAA